MGEEEKNQTITISRKEFVEKALKSILDDKDLSSNIMMGMVGMVVVNTIEKALFKNEEKQEEA